MALLLLLLGEKKRIYGVGGGDYLPSLHLQRRAGVDPGARPAQVPGARPALTQVPGRRRRQAGVGVEFMELLLCIAVVISSVAVVTATVTLEITSFYLQRQACVGQALAQAPGRRWPGPQAGVRSGPGRPAGVSPGGCMRYACM